MRIKKVAKVLLSCLMAGLLLTGCGSDSGSDSGSETKDPASQATTIKLGMITHLNATERKMAEILNMMKEKSNTSLSKYEIIYYDSLNLMQMGIESGSVDQISLYSSVASYMVANSDKFELVNENSLKKLDDNFCFAVRKEDTALKADLDKVIGEMKSDGSLDKLISDYVTNVDKGKTPPAIDIPKIDGADKIKVGVTGDLPPLDYISADGNAAGFNTALLAEVAKRLNKNIEVVQIKSGARAAALNSDQIDVVFWAILPVDDRLPSDVDKPEGLELSTPYFKDSVAHLKFKE